MYLVRWYREVRLLDHRALIPLTPFSQDWEKGERSSLPPILGEGLGMGDGVESISISSALPDDLWVMHSIDIGVPQSGRVVKLKIEN